MTSTQTRPTVAFAHLGCEKNRVDTEHMVGLLAKAGYGVSTNEQEAAVVVVNTCSFIQDAREESVRTLVGLAEQGKELIIAGCLAQHFQEELLESIPEAKAIVGTGDYQHIVEVLERVEAGERVNRVSAVPTFVGDEHLPRQRTTDQAVAFLKVAEGCDYRCAFCIIPKLRGDQRSRSIESIVTEAHQLADLIEQAVIHIRLPGAIHCFQHVRMAVLQGQIQIGQHVGDLSVGTKHLGCQPSGVGVMNPDPGDLHFPERP